MTAAKTPESSAQPSQSGVDAAEEAEAEETEEARQTAAEAAAPIQKAAEDDETGEAEVQEPGSSIEEQNALVEEQNVLVEEESGSTATEGPQPPSGSELVSVLESLLFVADRPTSVYQLAKATGAETGEVGAAVDALMQNYQERGIQLDHVAGGYQFRTSQSNSEYVRAFTGRKPVKLSRAQLETLAIVAYRQPVTRPEVDEIRGVDCGAALKALLERELLRLLGRKEEPGRPLLYGTTPFFLQHFGLGSLRDLPTLREFAELSEESRALFERKTGQTYQEEEPSEGTAEEVASKTGSADDVEVEPDAQTMPPEDASKLNGSGMTAEYVKRSVASRSTSKGAEELSERDGEQAKSVQT